MSLLFEPLTLRSVRFRNPSMCQYRAQGGVANDWHRVHYASRVVGAVDLITSPKQADAWPQPYQRARAG